MIVYNVKRRWFTMKADAEAYRKAEGLPPSGTFLLRVEDRDDLASLLNGLCSAGPTPAVDVDRGTTRVPAEVIERSLIEAPDYVPRFLVEEWKAKKEGRYHP